MISTEHIPFTRRGTGGPLLVIQGLSATQRFWGTKFLAELEQRFDVVTYDHRGVDKSPQREGGFSVADLARDAAEIIGAQGWRSAGIFGVSMGGMVAQELALVRPEVVKYLVLGCTRANGGSFGRPGDVVTERWVSAYVHGDEEATRRNMFKLSFSAHFTERTDAWATYLEMTRIKVDSVTSVRQISAVREFDVRERLANLNVPVMVMHGDEDEMVPYDEGIEIARRIRRARFETIPDTGHFFWIERPSWTAKTLKAFATDAAPEMSTH